MSDARSSSKGTLFGIHYAWIVCIACTLIMYGNNGITGSMFSLYQPFIKDMYGITNTQMSFILTTRSIMSLLAVVVCSFYYKVFSIRIGMLVASILCGGSFLLFGYSETFPMFLLSGVLLGLGSGFGTNIPVSMALRLWFNKKRKLAMSITVLAGSVGLLGLPSVLTNIIEGVSLRAGFIVNAAIVFAVTVIAIILMRNSPDEMGCEPYGSRGEADADKRDASERGKLENIDWAILGAVCIAIGIICCTSYSYLSLFLSFEGVSAEDIALVLSVTGRSVGTGKMCFGALSEKFSSYACNTLYFVALFVGISLMTLFVHNTAVLFVAIALLGFGSPLASVGFVSWGWDLTSEDQNDRAVQIMQICLYIGMVGFDFLPGVIADLIGGSYRPIFMGYALLCIPTFLGIQYLYRKNRRR